MTFHQSPPGGGYFSAIPEAPRPPPINYWTINTLTGETIWLEQSVEGQWADAPWRQRYPQSILGNGSVASDYSPVGWEQLDWRLGVRGSQIVLSWADNAAILPALQVFGNTGTISAPVTVAVAGCEVTRVMVDWSHCNRAPPFGDGKPVAQLRLAQGGISFTLTQQNAADLGALLPTVQPTESA